MVFERHKDGKIYPHREMLDALEYAQENCENFIERFSFNVENALQI